MYIARTSWSSQGLRSSQINYSAAQYQTQLQPILRNRLEHEPPSLPDHELASNLTIEYQSIADRMVLVHLCMQDFHLSLLCKEVVHQSQTQASWNIYIMSQHKKNIEAKLQQFFKKNQLSLEALYDSSLHSSNSKKELMRFQQVIKGLNQESDIIKLIKKSQISKLQLPIERIENQGREYGLYFTFFEDQYCLVYSKSLRNQDWEGVIQLQISKSTKDNIGQLQNNIQVSPFDVIIQCDDSINVLISFPFRGIQQALKIISMLISSKTINYYSDFTIIKKRQLPDTKIIDTGYCLVKHLCHKQRKDAQVENKEETLASRKNKDFDEFNSQDLQLITEQYSQSHILYLKEWWQKGLRKWMKTICRYWKQQYHLLYQRAITKFIRLLDYQSFEIKEKYEYFYPQSTKIIDNFMQMLRIKRIQAKIDERIVANLKQTERQQLTTSEKEDIKGEVLGEAQPCLIVSDYLVDSILKQLFFKNRQQSGQKIRLSISTELLKNKAINLSSLVSVMVRFNAETLKWQYALNTVCKNVFKMPTIKKNVKKEMVREKNEEKIQALKESKKNVAPEAYFEQIESQNVTKVDCLGCSRHFCFNMNIFDKLANKTTNIIVFKTIDSLLKKQSEILKQTKTTICSLLNDIQGGVILFNCEKKYQNIMTLGTVITQKMKQDLKRIIDQILQSFYPQVGSQNVVVNFVPVIANPYTVKPFEGKELPYGGQLGLIKTKKYIRRKFYQGTYVMRIIIKPIDQSRVFYFLHDGERLLFIRKSNTLKQLTPNYLHKIIKQKMTYYIPQPKDQLQKRLLKERTSLGHICQLPDKGICVNIRYDLINPGGGDYRQKTFQFVSLLNINEAHIQSFLQILTDLNIKSLIKPIFSQYQFTKDDTFILYHEAPFETLEDLISSHQSFVPLKDKFKIQNPTDYLKLKYHPSDTQKLRQKLLRCNQMLRSQFKLSKMHVCQVADGQQQELILYISGGSKLKNIFLHLVLRNQKQPVEFDSYANQIFKKNGHLLKDIKLSQEQDRYYVYNYLQNNLKKEPKAVCQYFLRIFKIYNLDNIEQLDHQRIFSDLFSSLIQYQSLTNWKKNLLDGFELTKMQLVQIIRQFFNSKACMFYMGEKLLRLCLQLAREQQSLFDKQFKKAIARLSYEQTVEHRQEIIQDNMQVDLIECITNKLAQLKNHQRQTNVQVSRANGGRRA